MKADSPDDSSQDIRVFTLNCWGLKCVSAKRKERMEAIGTYLANSDYDIVLLEEVWTTEDFERIRQAVQDTYPFYHFFDNGIIGSGTCIFTRAQIRDATFHEFTMNGYPHKIWHGDWFGGKGLGVCQIFYKVSITINPPILGIINIKFFFPFRVMIFTSIYPTITLNIIG